MAAQLRPCVVSIMGPPGAGKTTVLASIQAALTHRLDVKFLNEDIAGYSAKSSSADVTLAEAVSPTATSDTVASFQWKVVSSIARAYSNLDADARLVFSDQSLHHCRPFVLVQRAMGKISDPMATQILTHLDILQPLLPSPSLYFMLDTSPDLLLDRVTTRNRTAEQSYSKTYLSALHRHSMNMCFPAPVIRICSEHSTPEVLASFIIKEVTARLGFNLDAPSDNLTPLGNCGRAFSLTAPNTPVAAKNALTAADMTKLDRLDGAEICSHLSLTQIDDDEDISHFYQCVKAARSKHSLLADKPCLP